MFLESREIAFRDPDETVVIAEVGVNHNGSLDMARRLVDVARDAGVDVVKFQRFNSALEISTHAPKADYQQQATGDTESQLEMCRALELPDPYLLEMRDYCRSVGMPFLCTAFEEDSLEFLTGRMKLKAVKIPSPEVTNIPFLRRIGRAGVGAILSTGASTLSEVAFAIETLTEAGCPELVLMHCVSEYPTPPEQANLRAMQTLREAFRLPVGFSDHTEGYDVAIAAAALGACTIEKHFTLDRSLPGPDHQASLEPGELAALVRGVRRANRSLGTGIKRPMPCEIGNRPVIRKSIVCGVGVIEPGTLLTEAMLGVKRPWSAEAIEPADLEKVLGLTLRERVTHDQPLTWKMFREHSQRV